MRLLFNILPYSVAMVMMFIFATLFGLTRSELKETKKANAELKAQRDEARAEAESMLRFCKDQGWDVHKLTMPDNSVRAFRVNPDGTPNAEDVIKAVQADMQRRKEDPEP